MSAIPWASTPIMPHLTNGFFDRTFQLFIEFSWDSLGLDILYILDLTFPRVLTRLWIKRFRIG